MKLRSLLLFLSLAIISFIGCDPLNTKIDTMTTQENLDSDFAKLRELGYAPYTYLRNGFWQLDGNISAARSDEAEYTAARSSVQLFNEGSWNQYNNPDDVYGYSYQGIKDANFFLDYSEDYKNQLALNRDTFSDNGYRYRQDVMDIAWLRAEARVLKAYFYFELMKRYGDVPLVETVLGLSGNADLLRESVEKIVDYAVDEIDAVLDDLQPNWKVAANDRDGRFTKGAALALKSRMLLYAASPLHNPSGDVDKWQRAAAAAHEVIALNQYSLDNNYRTLFLESNSALSGEIIMSMRAGATNDMEKANYPVGTPGGNSGVTPSHNLVSAYEYKGTPDPDNPYANRDPRLLYCVVTNNSEWNGRTMEIYPGGIDDPAKNNTSRTGYYLKKFLIEDLYLVQDEKRLHNWVMFRYGEILLNYAEAMNEAYGPDADPEGYGMTARQAINMVRARNGVAMPPVEATGQSDMRLKIKHERRIELAFEDHRYWDLARWKDGEVLNQPLKGVRVTKDEDAFNYTEFTVENRIFQAPKMYLYPIPHTEIVKSNNILMQNPEW